MGRMEAHSQKELSVNYGNCELECFGCQTSKGKGWSAAQLNTRVFGRYYLLCCYIFHFLERAFHASPRPRSLSCALSQEQQPLPCRNTSTPSPDVGAVPTSEVRAGRVQAQGVQPGLTFVHSGGSRMFVPLCCFQQCIFPHKENVLILLNSPNLQCPCRKSTRPRELCKSPGTQAEALMRMSQR